MPVVDLYRDCPGYAEAARREREIRDVPFLGLPEDVAGIPCAPLTRRRLVLLQLSKSPFLLDMESPKIFEAICQREAILSDLLLFFWIVSPTYKDGAKFRKRKRARQVLEKTAKKSVRQVVGEIKEYIFQSFMDAGFREGGKSFYSSCAPLVSFYSKEYGMEIDAWDNSLLRRIARKISGKPNPIDVPLKIEWQLQRASLALKKGDAIFSNPISDQMVGLWIKGRNSTAK